MNDRPERYMFKGKLVPKVCSLCTHKLYEWQYKRVYLDTVVHRDCFKDNHEAEERELAEKFGTGRVKSFEVDTSGAKTTTVKFDETFIAGEDAWKEAIGEESKEVPIEGLREAARYFESGATRDTDVGKLDFEAFLSPAVLVRYAEHLEKHSIQSDGEKRAGDNWQRGIPKEEYMKSLFRHFMAAWSKHRSTDVYLTEDLEEDLCGVMFNSMGYLFEVLKEVRCPDCGSTEARDYNGRDLNTCTDCGQIVPKEKDKK